MSKILNMLFGGGPPPAAVAAPPSDSKDRGNCGGSHVDCGDRDGHANHGATPATTDSTTTSIVGALFATDLRTAKLLENRVKGADFTYARRHFLAKIVECYDGDTVRAAFVPPESYPVVVQYKIRMLGYDSCEMKPLRSAPERELEKKMAANARDALIGKIGNDLVVLECGEFDKNGRILATLYNRSGENINSWMVESGYGWPYDGKTKSVAREAASKSPALARQREIAQQQLGPNMPVAPAPRKIVKEASRRQIAHAREETNSGDTITTLAPPTPAKPAPPTPAKPAPPTPTKLAPATAKCATTAKLAPTKLVPVPAKPPLAAIRALPATAAPQLSAVPPAATMAAAAVAAQAGPTRPP